MLSELSALAAGIPAVLVEGADQSQSGKVFVQGCVTLVTERVSNKNSSRYAGLHKVLDVR